MGLGFGSLEGHQGFGFDSFLYPFGFFIVPVIIVMIVFHFVGVVVVVVDCSVVDASFPFRFLFGLFYYLIVFFFQIF